MASHSEISINPFYFSDEQLDILFRGCPIRTLKRHEYVHQSGELVQTEETNGDVHFLLPF